MTSETANSWSFHIGARTERWLPEVSCRNKWANSFSNFPNPVCRSSLKIRCLATGTDGGRLLWVKVMTNWCVLCLFTKMQVLSPAHPYQTSSCSHTQTHHDDTCRGWKCKCRLTLCNRSGGRRLFGGGSRGGAGWWGGDNLLVKVVTRLIAEQQVISTTIPNRQLQGKDWSGSGDSTLYITQNVHQPKRFSTG